MWWQTLVWACSDQAQTFVGKFTLETLHRTCIHAQGTDDTNGAVFEQDIEVFLDTSLGHAVDTE